MGTRERFRLRRRRAVLSLRTSFAFFIGFACLLLLVESGTEQTEAWAAVPIAKSLAHGETMVRQRPPGPYVRGPTGAYWLAQDYLAPVLATPLVMLAERIAPAGIVVPDFVTAAAASTGALVTAICAVLVLTFSVSRLRVPARSAMIGVVVGIFGTFLLHYSRGNYDGNLSGMLLVAGLSVDGSPRRLSAFWAGILWGLACLARFTSIAVVAFLALGVCASVTSWRFRIHKAVRIAAGMIPSVVVWYELNLLRTGHGFIPPSALPEYQNNALVGPFWDGFVGNLVSPAKGLLFFGPLAILGLVGLGVARRRLLLFMSAGGLLALLSLHAKVVNWSGHWGWGPRYLVPAIPLCLLGLGVLIASRRSRWIIAALAVPSVLVQFLAVIAHPTLRIAVTAGNVVRPFDVNSSQLADHLRVLVDVLAGRCPDMTYYAPRCVPDLWWVTWPRLGGGHWPQLAAGFLALGATLGLALAWRWSERPEGQAVASGPPQHPSASNPARDRGQD
jgi:hypothetical protein